MESFPFQEALDEHKKIAELLGAAATPEGPRMRYIGDKDNYVNNRDQFGRLFQKHIATILPKIRSNIFDGVMEANLPDVLSIRHFVDKHWARCPITAKMSNPIESIEISCADRLEKLEEAIRNLVIEVKDSNSKVEKSVMSLKNSSKCKLRPAENREKTVDIRETIIFSFKKSEIVDAYQLQSPTVEIAGSEW
uniref:Uncharacterized protein n=1 Tax=Ditylenchus dipsaci TaxID=166011 RepID=A0A915EU99_9BILA